MNQHEDDLSSGILRAQPVAGFAEAADNAQEIVADAQNSAQRNHEELAIAAV